MELLVLVVLAVAGVSIVVVVRKRRESSKDAGPRVDPVRAHPDPNDPRGLKVGDIVALDGVDWLIRGTLHFDQDGFTWQEHFLDDASRKRWLSVEDDEELEVVLWESVPAAGLDPSGDTVVHDGTTYTVSERGTARYRAEGTTGTGTEGTAEYADFENGERRISFERFGSVSTWEVGAGTVVAPSALDIYPSASRQ